MEQLQAVFKYLQEFWINGSQFVNGILTTFDFYFVRTDFLHFITFGALFTFLGVAVVKWFFSR